eukprot:TRINITY_DN2484_c0_g1_i1.p1 TRINITY_DN2484_c0_g1~~TRINITY_DN2484_c0_g1_i1.p1  ORF type:complete len:572 (-),score=177.84 TRINITY_DN2484_c0_g1_i1:210-1925(-)
MTIPNKVGYSPAHAKRQHEAEEKKNHDGTTNDSEHLGNNYDSNLSEDIGQRDFSPNVNSNSKLVGSGREQAAKISELLEKTLCVEKLSPEEIQARKIALGSNLLLPVALLKIEQYKPNIMDIVSKRLELVSNNNLNLQECFEVKVPEKKDDETPTISNEEREAIISKLADLKQKYITEIEKINKISDDLAARLMRLLKEQSGTRLVTDQEIHFKIEDLRSRFNIVRNELRQHIYNTAMEIRKPLVSEKKRRRTLNKQATEALNEWFFSHLSDPYPTEEDKNLLSQEYNLTMAQVNNWFGNKRIRYKKKIMEEQLRKTKILSKEPLLLTKEQLVALENFKSSKERAPHMKGLHGGLRRANKQYLPKWDDNLIDVHAPSDLFEHSELGALHETDGLQDHARSNNYLMELQLHSGLGLNEEEKDFESEQQKSKKRRQILQKKLLRNHQLKQQLLQNNQFLEGHANKDLKRLREKQAQTRQKERAAVLKQEEALKDQFEVPLVETDSDFLINPSLLPSTPIPPLALSLPQVTGLNGLSVLPGLSNLPTLSNISSASKTSKVTGAADFALLNAILK